VTGACTYRLANGVTKEGATVIGDSWFGSVKAALSLKKDLKCEFIGNVKTSHPKAYVEEKLKDHPAGSRLVLTAMVDGVELVAIGYKYKRKVLSFVATKGAGATTNGEPYIQRWTDMHGNVMTRPVPRPAVCSNYFANSPRVDNHNQSRQHDLGLEEEWQTQDPWFRLVTTIIGMVVTDAWKLTRHHLAHNHRLSNATIKAFADELAYALLTNELRDRELPLRSIAVRVVRPPLQDISNGTSTTAHRPKSLGRTNGHTKQHRCRWCLVHENKECWTSVICEKCDLSVCSPIGKHGRLCWDLHCTANVEELRRVAKRHRVEYSTTSRTFEAHHPPLRHPIVI